jgi:hypothetical protein
MAGDIADFLLSLAAPHLHGVLVVVNGNKFITENPGKSRVRLPLYIEVKQTVLAYNLSRSKQKMNLVRSLERSKTKRIACSLKVHKNENFFGFDFEFCTISLFVMHK